VNSLWIRLACILPGLALMGWVLMDGPMIGSGIGFGLFEKLIFAFGVLTALAGLLPLRFTANYLAFFVMTVLMLVVAEIVLQSTVRGRYFSSNEFDERVLFKMRPGAERKFTHLPANGGKTVSYRVNSDGYVGPELLPVGERTRVVVFGDSFTHAEFSAYEDRFTTRLRGELSERLGREVEVINAGVAGYGPDQILRRMQTELDMLRPDLVIVNIFTGNDFGDLLRNRLYRLDETGRLVENDYRLSPEQERQIALNRHELILLRVLKDAWRRLSPSGPDHFKTFDPADWIERAMAQHLREYEEFVVRGDNIVGEFSVDPYTVDIAVDPDLPSSRYKLRMMAAVLDAMKAEADRAGVPLFITAIPHPMDLLDGDHASGRIDKIAYPDYRPTRLTDALTGIAAETGLPHLNLYAPFKASDPEALYLKGGDDHWNAAGQALAAKLVAIAVTGAGLLGE